MIICAITKNSYTFTSSSKCSSFKRLFVSLVTSSFSNVWRFFSMLLSMTSTQYSAISVLLFQFAVSKPVRLNYRELIRNETYKRDLSKRRHRPLRRDSLKSCCSLTGGHDHEIEQQFYLASLLHYHPLFYTPA